MKIRSGESFRRRGRGGFRSGESFWRRGRGGFRSGESFWRRGRGGFRSGESFWRRGRLLDTVRSGLDAAPPPDGHGPGRGGREPAGRREPRNVASERRKAASSLVDDTASHVWNVRDHASGRDIGSQQPADRPKASTPIHRFPRGSAPAQRQGSVLARRVGQVRMSRGERWRVRQGLGTAGERPVRSVDPGGWVHADPGRRLLDAVCWCSALGRPARIAFG